MRSSACLVLGILVAATSAYGAWHAICYNLAVVVGDTAALAIIAGLLTVGLVLAAVKFRAPALNVCRAALDRFEHGSDRAWIIAIIAIAVVLRVGWCMLVPPVQVSDTALYFELAERLALGGTYAIETTYATWTRTTWASWPPGLPLALAPLVWLFGAGAYVPLVFNLLLIVVTILAAHALVRHRAGVGAARLAGLVIACWPNLVMLSGQASKELLALALLTASAALLFARAADDLPATRIILAGACQGGCLLTQPAFLLLPLLPAAVFWLAAAPWRQVGRALVLTLLGAAIVVGPWTARNVAVLGEFVLVSTGGGSILYRANHDEANGGYLSLGDRLPYEDLGETEQDRLLTRDALRWIRENPDRFAVLAFLKHRAYFGDDSSGPYSSLRRSNDISDARYVALKGLTNLLWLGLLVVMGPLMLRSALSGRLGEDPDAIYLALIWMYLLAVHTIAESGSRHHLAMTALILGYIIREARALAACGTCRPERALAFLRTGNPGTTPANRPVTPS